MSDSVTARAPKLKPLTTALELRDATIRDYRKAAERVGAPVDMREIERQAVADCNVYDGVTRDAKPARKQTPEELAEIRRIRKEQLAREQADVGAVAVKPSQIVRRRVKQMHGVAHPDERWAAAMKRIARLLRGVKAPVGRMSNIDAARKFMFEDCEIPHLADRIDQIRAQMVVRDRMPRPGDEPNPFFGMNKKDAGDLLQRLLEDVCDLSTGKCGPWLVPK